MAASATLSEENKLLYSRQLYVVGAETQAKYGTINVLVIGSTGLAAEVVKDLALTGVQSIAVYDDNATVSLHDLTSFFFATESSVGASRAETLVKHAKPLNPLVDISVVTGSLPELVPRFSVVVAVDQNTTASTMVELNAVARQHKVQFVACESRGVAGCIFVDAGDNFDVFDTDGEEPVSCVVTGITKDGLITMHEDKQHECEVGGKVYLTGVSSPDTLNSTVDTTSSGGSGMRLFEVVEIVSPFILRVKGIDEALAKAGVTQLELGTRAYLHTTKRQICMTFKSLKDSITNPDYCMIFDSAEKMTAAPELHAIFQAAHHQPSLATPESVAAAAAEAQRLCPDLGAEFAKDVLRVFNGNLTPMAGFIGGLAAQEVLKVCSGKFTPLQQWLYFDARELLYARGPVKAEDLQSTGSRYEGQIAVLGKAFQSFLGNQTAFIVGAGALGCEHIKNLACMGVHNIEITDMDSIEMSNLSRQFLFRNSDIGKPKSVVAGTKAKEINGLVNISAHNSKVGADTEDIFNELFWEKLAIVVNALDNVESRKYVDARCQLFQKPLIESGTLGTKCNVQCVIPFLTESYGASYDPPERSIPLCTLKNFPNAIEHTIQWARDAFEMLFVNTPREVNNYLESPSNFAETMERDPGSKPLVVKAVMEALLSRPRDARDCVKMARMKFNDFFTESLLQLLHNIPLDKKNENGEPFWSGAKKPPTPAEFDPTNPLHANFIFHTAAVFAAVYKLPSFDLTLEQAVEISKSVEVPKFVPRTAAFAMSEAEKSDQSAVQLAGTVELSDLPSPNLFPGFRMESLEFEKDNPRNHHVDFITYCSNLRATAYGIPPADFLKTKQIVGKIIPAMITTTAVATGLVAFEVLKYFLLRFNEAKLSNPNGNEVSSSALTPHEQQMHKKLLNLLDAKKNREELLALYRSAFVNISLPFVAFSDPIAAPSRTYALPDGGSITWTSWDRVDINEGRDLTVKELVQVLEQRYSLSVFMIALSSGKMVFTSFGKQANNVKLVSAIAVERGEEIRDNVSYLTLVVTGMIEDTDVDIPIVHYRFRNF